MNDGSVNRERVFHESMPESIRAPLSTDYCAPFQRLKLPPPRESQYALAAGRRSPSASVGAVTDLAPYRSSWPSYRFFTVSYRSSRICRDRPTLAENQRAPISVYMKLLKYDSGFTTQSSLFTEKIVPLFCKLLHQLSTVSRNTEVLLRYHLLYVLFLIDTEQGHVVNRH